MNEIHFKILGEVQRGPRVDIQLLGEFGEDYETILKDLRTNNYPVETIPSNSPDLPESRVFYFEKPGQELLPCVWCKRRTRSIGPFCSIDCEEDWISEVMSPTVEEAQEEPTNVYTPRAQKPSEPTQRIKRLSNRWNREHATRWKLRFSNFLRPASKDLGSPISAASVLHIAQKAKKRGRITEDVWWVLMSLGSKVYAGKALSSMDSKKLRIAIDRMVRAGIQDDKCEKPACVFCDEFRKFAQGTTAENRASIDSIG